MSGAQTGRLIGGRHRVEGPAGDGVLGPVLRAHDEQEDAPVAVEVARDEALVADDLGERLSRAVGEARRVEHPVLVRPVDVGTDDDRPYVATAWIDGDDLGHRYSAGPPPAAEAADLVEQLAGALDAVHAAGQVHGDLGPACVLVRDTPSGPRAWLTGLGVRRTVLEAGVGPALTRAPETAGLPGALAPELADGGTPDARADVYALACLAFELLSGTPPFTGPTGAAVLTAHATRPRPRVTSRRPELPRELDLVLERGMAIDPAERPPSAGALAAAVAGALGDRPHAGDDRAMETGTGAVAWDVTHDLPASAGSRDGRRDGADAGRRDGRRSRPSSATRVRRRVVAAVVVVVAAVGGAVGGVALAASDDGPPEDAGAPPLAAPPRFKEGTKLPQRPADAPGPVSQRAVVLQLRDVLSGSRPDSFSQSDWSQALSPRLQVESPESDGRCTRTAPPRAGTELKRGAGYRQLQVLSTARRLPWALEDLAPAGVRFAGRLRASWSGVAVLPSGERREVRYWLARTGLGTEWLVDLVDLCPRTGTGS
ncbi:serine/threonine-protein kinase [Patulibacter minatonensis]|uniref:serine/threonine-protein kinase n=1 Tax=Patulibacter minatonensis TaxID=298163 RepID=UPI00047A683F|nr:serine/threonine-protein kinase [Patulibacter minatonensis]